MRLTGALAMAVLVWAMTGCGGSVSGPGSRGAGSGLVLADEAEGGRFLLNVAGGAPELVEMSGVGAASDPAANPELIDGVTGAVYSLGVSRGALTLTPAAGASGVAQIEFVDAATEKPYALAVVRGGLTLFPG
jgi:hypothetical protein